MKMSRANRQVSAMEWLDYGGAFGEVLKLINGKTKGQSPATMRNSDGP